MHVFKSDFRQERKKMTLELYLKGENKKKLEQWKNAEILVNSVQSGLFGHSKG